MKTTYYLTGIQSVWRATTKVAREKMAEMSEKGFSSLTPITPREARERISNGCEYVKVQDII